VSAGRILRATVITPPDVRDPHPLLALHGIARNAGQLVDAFSREAGLQGRVVVVPCFEPGDWPVFQRVTDRIRPDLALLSLMHTLRGLAPVFERPFDLFGYSGGAQLAHRFAMLYPERVRTLHLGAAGWYTLPDPATAYPLGVADGGSGDWGRRMRSGLPDFLSRQVTVYVGALDNQQDATLRRGPELDRVQGSDRVERARRYVDCLLAQQSVAGLPPSARAVLLPDCGHDFLECDRLGELAKLACTGPALTLLTSPEA
jgi:pimeloyl-ACP methyl ester carboxylesterase